MKINPVNPGMSLIPCYESDYSDESWCIFKFQHIFLGYASEVKVYQLWSLYPKFPKLVIEKNVNLNEFSLFYQKEETTFKIDTRIQDNVLKNIEFEDIGI